MKSKVANIILILVLGALLFTACVDPGTGHDEQAGAGNWELIEITDDEESASEGASENAQQSAGSTEAQTEMPAESASESASESAQKSVEKAADDTDGTASDAWAEEEIPASDAAVVPHGSLFPEGFDPEDIPEYSGKKYVLINDGVPFFSDEDMTVEAFEYYSSLDELGRCGTAYANVCRELMPTEKRGDISEIHPTGWRQKRYDGIVDADPPYLYNRSHLIAYKLAGENANIYNLITGTRYFNAEGMTYVEDKVAEYVKDTGNHVLYRVTPVFVDKELLSRGVLMEAKSVEDDRISFCEFVYNVQPGIYIDYSDGYSKIN